MQCIILDLHRKAPQVQTFVDETRSTSHLMMWTWDLSLDMTTLLNAALGWPDWRRREQTVYFHVAIFSLSHSSSPNGY